MNLLNRNLQVLAGLLLVLSCAVSHGAVIDPVNAVTSSQFTLTPGYSRTALDTINATGLSAVPTEANILTVKTNEVPDDTVTHGGQWLTENGNGDHAVISYDLGIPTLVSAVYVWNYSEVAGANTMSPGDYSNRGAKNVDIYASTSLNSSAPGGGDTLIEHTTFSQATPTPLTGTAVGGGNWNADYNTSVVEYTFPSPVLAQYIKLNITSSWADASFVGLSEVRFEGVPVPEPASLCMLGLGAAALLYLGRKARRS